MTCRHPLTDVYDSRPGEIVGFHTVRRRRECKKCGEKFSTYELSGEALQLIVSRLIGKTMGQIQEALSLLDENRTAGYLQRVVRSAEKRYKKASHRGPK